MITILLPLISIIFSSKSNTWHTNPIYTWEQNKNHWAQMKHKSKNNTSLYFCHLFEMKT